jgi:hypothetical protein
VFVLVAVLLLIFIPLIALGLPVLQNSLEAWDHQRHAND